MEDYLSHIEKYKGTHFFRGQANCLWPITPSLVFHLTSVAKARNEKRPFPLFAFDFNCNDNPVFGEAKKVPNVSSNDEYRIPYPLSRMITSETPPMLKKLQQPKPPTKLNPL